MYYRHTNEASGRKIIDLRFIYNNYVKQFIDSKDA